MPTPTQRDVDHFLRYFREALEPAPRTASGIRSQEAQVREQIGRNWREIQQVDANNFYRYRETDAIRLEESNLNASRSAMVHKLASKPWTGEVTDSNAQRLCKRCGTQHGRRDPCVGVEDALQVNGTNSNRYLGDDHIDALAFYAAMRTTRPAEPYWAVT